MLLYLVSGSLGGHHDRTGTYTPNAFLWAFWTGAAVLYAFTYWFCRREAMRKLDPLLSRLVQLHRELVEG
jgi:hypothetical protein